MALDRKFVGTKLTSEFFNTAGRDVKMGLTASVIVSQWTWAATLLQSSNVAWQYGVSGPFWYASGATIQVLLFGILAIEIKRRAPTCHTVCELVLARWGPAAHKTFIYFSLLTSIIVTSMLLLGGSATINALAGCDLKLTSFLIPWRRRPPRRLDVVTRAARAGGASSSTPWPAASRRRSWRRTCTRPSSRRGVWSHTPPPR
jgi:hypothetical protein